MTTYLGKSCSFCLPRVPFVNCRQFMFLVISILVLRAGYGIRLYQFLIIAYLFTFQVHKLFRLFLSVLSFILLSYVIIKSENGTQELCLSLYPTHLTRAFLFFSLYYLFNSKYILLCWGKLSCIEGAKNFIII